MRREIHKRNNTVHKSCGDGGDNNALPVSESVALVTGNSSGHW
jgi:hypothetical protein